MNQGDLIFVLEDLGGEARSVILGGHELNGLLILALLQQVLGLSLELLHSVNLKRVYHF